MLLSVVALTLIRAPAARPASDDQFADERNRMVREQIESRGIRDQTVLDVMRATPRHLFVPDDLRQKAYADESISINSSVSIPRPYVAALMLNLLKPQKTDRVLEIGTGSGYQTALLSPLVQRVYTLEIVPDTARNARTRLSRLGFSNIVFRQGDGFGGWAEEAPFDCIILTVAPTELPPVLIQQLATGGRIVAPVGSRFDQELVLAEKKADGTLSWRLAGSVMFAPMLPPRS